MYSCCASGFTRERNTVTIIIALLRRISPRRASATDNFASWQTVPLRPHHGGRFLLGPNIPLQGGPLAAGLVHDPDLAVGVLDPRPVSNPLAVQPRRSVGTAALGRVVIFLGKRQLFLLRSVAVHDPELAEPFLVA